jgi:hypothetical protein
MVERMGGSWSKQPSRFTAEAPPNAAEPVLVDGQNSFSVPQYPVTVTISNQGHSLRLAREVQSGRLNDWTLQNQGGGLVFIGDVGKCPFDEDGLKKLLSQNGPPPIW